MPTLPVDSSSSPNSVPALNIDIRSEGPITVIALKGHIGSFLADADRGRIQATIHPGAQLALDFTELREISGVNFAVYSRHGTKCTLVLHEHGYGYGIPE
jgi:hypothetical protein